MLTPNGNLSKRKTIQLMVALTILAWATQTLLHQWGFGAVIAAMPTTEPSEQLSQEKFVPTNAASRGATLELRAEATIVGPDVKLKQVCRWTDADNAAIAPLADLVLIHIKPGKPFRSISVNEIKSTLQEAHVNLAGIDFVGPLACTINRSDGDYEQSSAMQQWIDARTGDTPATAPAASTTMVVTEATPTPAAAVIAAPVTHTAAENSGVHTLRELLTQDVAVRLSVPADTLQMDFKPLDEAVLALSQPLFKFQIEATRVRNLGEVAWDVTVISGSGNRKVNITATARAWQNQAILAKPLAYRQMIREGDVTERRTLVSALSDDPLVSKSQAVGQQASRDLKPGTILNSRMLDPVELIKMGQFVTITVTNGGVSIKTVARAMENGSLGQVLKVKNETTKDIYDVLVTGPQTASLNSDAPPPNNVALTN